MIVVVGLSHRTAPIEVREKVALSQDEAKALCESLVRRGQVAEAFVVSTCNRVEIVAVPPNGPGPELCVEACRKALTERHEGAAPYLYVRIGVDGVRHLVRVASSLDSLVVGEPQILGQLKQGFELSRSGGSVGPTLHRVFAWAVRGAKSVRSGTSIGSGQVSVPSIAIDLAVQIFGNLAGHRAVLVGSGEMGQTVARLLTEAGAISSVVGRSLERTGRVAEAVGGTAHLIDELPELLAEADVVVSSTSSPTPVITAATVSTLSKVRRGRHLFIIDLAVPRDVEPTVGELDGVFLYNVDDLSTVAEQSASSRRKEAERAARLVEEIVADYERWAGGEQATPMIKALRGKLRSAFETELRRSLRGRLRDLDDEQRRALAKMLDASLNRILHAPTVLLRDEATRGDDVGLEELSETLNRLFALDDVDESVLDGSTIEARYVSGATACGDSLPPSGPGSDAPPSFAGHEKRGSTSSDATTPEPTETSQSEARPRSKNGRSRGVG